MLIEYQDKGWINEEERDALRHYYTMMGLADSHGPTISWLAGIIHEDFGYDLMKPESNQSYKDTKADLHNNNIALDHFEKLKGKNIMKNLFLATDKDAFRMPLQFLKLAKDFGAPSTEEEVNKKRMQDAYLYDHLKPEETKPPRVDLNEGLDFETFEMRKHRENQNK